MKVEVILDNDTNLYFAETENNGLTAIIVDNKGFEIDMYCSPEQAEKLAKQLQKYINKYKLKIVE